MKMQNHSDLFLFLCIAEKGCHASEMEGTQTSIAHSFYRIIPRSLKKHLKIDKIIDKFGNFLWAVYQEFNKFIITLKTAARILF